MKDYKEANKFLVNNRENYSLLAMLGPNYLETLINSKHKEKIEQLGKILQENEMYFMPIKYVDAYLDGKINEDEFIKGKGVFKNPPKDIELGLPDFAIEMAIGTDCKKNKSSSEKGKKEEWIYYAEHKEMEREVIAYKFTFTDNKLTSFEDKSENSNFKYPASFNDFENDESCSMNQKYSFSRLVFAEISEGLDEKREEEGYDFDAAMRDGFEFIFDTNTNLEEKDKNFFTEDSTLKMNCAFVTGWIEGESGSFDSEMVQISLGSSLEDVLGNVDHVFELSAIPDEDYNRKMIVEKGQEAIDRLNELKEKRKKNINLLDLDQLSEWGYQFEDSQHKESYNKLYNLILEDYQKKLPSEIPFEKEFEKLTESFELLKQKQENPPKSTSGCYVATATMGDYNHPTVRNLRIFRDDYLDKRRWGSSFIKHYYYWGPYLAKVIGKSNFLKMLSYFIIIKPLAFIASKLIRS